MSSPPSADSGHKRSIYQVSDLVSQVRDLLEHSFPLLWVEGEISNFAKPRSGHWYFNLKDDKSQVRCAMFRNRNRLLSHSPAEGDLVQIRARVSLYSARGEFQLIAEDMQPAGDGALRRAFEQLKARLQAEGLFDEPIKQPIPGLPRRIGVITSATGAAFQDIRSVLQRRFPLAQLILYPVPVQGEAAPEAIVRALEIANQRAECDVLIVGRGGGSLEDLQAFNEESVARAIHASALPIISAVGHEIDFSIADFVADLRAATPSAAAELVAPDQQVWLRRLDTLANQLARQQRQRMQQAATLLAQQQARLGRQHPGRRLEAGMQRLDELDQRLRRSLQQRRQRLSDRWQHQQQRLLMHHPGRRIALFRQKLSSDAKSLHSALAQQLDRHRHALGLASRALDGVSPLRTLERGYAIASQDGAAVKDAAALKRGDMLDLRFHRGSAACEVNEVTSQ